MIHAMFTAATFACLCMVSDAYVIQRRPSWSPGQQVVLGSAPDSRSSVQPTVVVIDSSAFNTGYGLRQALAPSSAPVPRGAASLTGRSAQLSANTAPARSRRLSVSGSTPLDSRTSMRQPANDFWNFMMADQMGIDNPMAMLALSHPLPGNGASGGGAMTTDLLTRFWLMDSMDLPFGF